MNIVYIHTHDTGRYIEPYGYGVSTPNLMRLAQDGVLFRNAYSTAPTCSPSRSAMMTGMRPYSTGMIGLAHRGFQMSDYSKHLAQYLKKHGYETALCGIQHEAPDVDMLGYSRILGNQQFDMAVFDFDSESWDLENALAVAKYVKEEKDQPFFLSFGMFNTHLNFPPTKRRHNPNYVQVPHPLFENQENRELMAGYHTSLEVADNCAGIVLDAIEEAGLMDNTLIIFSTDHGLPFPRMKCNLYDTGIGVSLIMRTPNGDLKGEAVDAMVSHLDLFPTICDFAGLEQPDWLQGHSLMPIFKGESDSVRDHIFAEVTYHAAYEPMRTIRTERYKYIKYYDEEHQSYVPPNIDNNAAKAHLIEHGFLDQKRPEELLFDLYFDPVERVNVADDPAYQDIKQELIGRLEQWMQDTGDPIAEGPIAAPEGAIINNRTSLTYSRHSE